MRARQLILSSLSFVLIFGVALSACGKKSVDTSTTTTPSANGQTPGGPSPGTAIAFSSVTTTGMTLTWGAATDAVTAQSNLQYKLVQSTSNNISSVSTAEANGTLVMDWTANTTSKVVSGLSNETTYYFTVLIKNDAAVESYETATRATLCTGKMIYLANISNAAFGGKAGADTLCNAQKPSGFSGTAKAMIYDSTGGRRACSGADCTASIVGQLDWPIAGGTNYCSTGYGQTMGMSSGGFLNVTLANSLSSSSTYTFTGLNSLFGGSTNNCTDWTVWANPAVGNYGQANATALNFYEHGQAFCATNGSIYCIEQ
ncbi:MAG: DUF1554 domain-containing protein [Bdellovibrionales bacterium]